MKIQIIKSTIFLAIIILTSFACHPEETNNVAVGTFTVKLDGELFEGQANTASIIPGFLGLPETFTLIGNKLDLSSFSIVLSGTALDITPKTYSYSGDVGNCDPQVDNLCLAGKYTTTDVATSTGQEWGNWHSGSDLNVTFTSVDYRPGGNVKGTFDGKIYNLATQENMDVTEGVFNLKIQE